MKCNQIYWSEIHSKGQLPTIYYKWESDFYYASFDWKMINYIPYSCARETSLQSLQYKIINQFYPCRYLLHLWGKETDNKCSYCNQIDTLQHHFAECKPVMQFWNSIKTWYLHNFDFLINFGTLDILLGIPDNEESSEIKMLNFIILFGKDFIKSCKKTSKPIDFYQFQISLKDRMKLEKYFSILNHKDHKNQEIWSHLAEKL